MFNKMTIAKPRNCRSNIDGRYMSALTRFNSRLVKPFCSTIVTGSLVFGTVGVGGAALFSMAGCGGAARQQVVATAEVKREEIPAGKPLEEYNKAVTLYADGKRTKAELEQVVSGLKKVVGWQPGFAEAWFNLGVVYEELGKRDDARTAYQRALSLDDRNMNALANLGMLHMEAGKRDEAIDAFRKAVEAEPFNAAALNNLAVVARQNAVRLRDSGNAEGAQQFFAEAVANVRKVLAADPQNLPAYNNLALIYYELGRYQLAEMVSLTAMDFKDKDAAVHNNLGLIYLKLNRVIDATQQFQLAIEIDPDYVEALTNLGAITINFRDYKSSYDYFDRAAKLKPLSPWVLISRSVAARGLGDYDKAEQGYRQVLELDPDNLEALYNLAILQQEYQQKPKEALVNYRAFMAKAGDAYPELQKEVQPKIEGIVQFLEYMEKMEKEQVKASELKTAPEVDTPGKDSADTAASSGPADAEPAKPVEGEQEAKDAAVAEGEDGGESGNGSAGNGGNSDTGNGDTKVQSAQEPVSDSKPESVTAPAQDAE